METALRRHFLVMVVQWCSTPPCSSSLWPAASSACGRGPRPPPCLSPPDSNPAVLMLTVAFAATLSFVHIGLVWLMSAMAAAGAPVTRRELSWSAVVLWGVTVTCFAHYVSAPSVLGVHSTEWVVVPVAAALLLAVTAIILSMPLKVAKLDMAEA